MSGSSWLLGAGRSFQEVPAATSGVVTNPVQGLSLAALTTGPLGLDSPNGTLGGLRLPWWAAYDAATSRVCVLSTDGGRIYCYDPVAARLVALQEVGAEGLGPNPPACAFAEPRRFRSASAIAAFGGALYVADPGARRVQVFELETLALLHLHTGLDGALDVACGTRGVYVLAGARVYEAHPARAELRLIVDEAKWNKAWSRLAVDRDDTLYLLDASTLPPRLDVRLAPDACGCPRAAEPNQFADASDVRDRFEQPDGLETSIAVEDAASLRLPERLADPCGLRRVDPDAVRIDTGDLIFEIDRAGRELRVLLADGRLRRRFGPYGADLRRVDVDAADAWNPVDVAVMPGALFVLDEAHQSVYRLESGSEVLALAFTAPAGTTHWRRLASDGQGCLLLWDGRDGLERRDARGRSQSAPALRDVSQRFERPLVTKPKVPPPVRLGRDGSVRFSASATPRPRAYAAQGVYLSAWLDSGIYGCEWGAVELTIGDLPPGSSVHIRTRTSNDPPTTDGATPALQDLELASFSDPISFNGVPQPTVADRKPAGDFLVASGPGQHLQLLIALTGDGRTSPVIERIRLRFPHDSLLQYLPAIYSLPAEQRQFLRGFLGVVEATWFEIESRLDGFEAFFDPDSVPPPLMNYLASWLDVRLEDTWPAEDRRKALQAVPALRPIWGTPTGMERWLRVYLEHTSGCDEALLAGQGFPAIVESFVERRRLLLGRDDMQLGGEAGLWSPAVERRFQLGVYDREGDVELVSVGDPSRDVFRHYAHAFRVYVPSVWARTAEQEAQLRRAIDAQRPAHTSYELVLVEPRLRVGEQSTVGLDTIIGGPPSLALGGPPFEPAPSREPAGVLGVDLHLSGVQRDHAGARSLERVLS